MPVAMKDPESPLPASKPAIAWNPLLAIGLVILLYFAAQILASLVISIYPLAQHWSNARANDWISNAVTAQFSYVLLAEALTIGGVYGFIRLYKGRLSAIGVKRPTAGVLWAFPAFPVYFIALAIVVAVASHYVPALNINQTQQIGFNSVHGFGPLVLTFISLVVLPPLAEEILLRGFLYSSLRKWLPFVGATLVTSALFAAAHLPEGGSAGPLWIGAIDTFMLSLVLCFLREKTSNIWAGVLLHALKNFVAFYSLFILGSR